MGYFEDYFDEMDISESDKNTRVNFAMRIHDIMILTFALVKSMQESGYVDELYLKSELKRRYIEEVIATGNYDRVISDYINSFTDDTIKTTLKNTDEYLLSNTRALIIGANEANTIYNYSDYKNAVENGYTHKRWKTENDNLVRRVGPNKGGHWEIVNNDVVEIDEPFVVGDSLMMFPKDFSMGASAEELVNCRCTVEYIK